MNDRVHEEYPEAYTENKKKHQGEESQGAFREEQ